MYGTLRQWIGVRVAAAPLFLPVASSSFVYKTVEPSSSFRFFPAGLTVSTV